MKAFLKYSFFLLLIVIAIPIIFLAYISLNNYSPDYKTIIQENASSDIISDTAELNLMIWNIGYCGLNAEMDFFYSGGTQVYPEADVVNNNIRGVKRNLKNNEYSDFIMLQEVDENSQRSYFTNQVDTFNQLLKKHYSFMAYNYKVPFVPMPVTNPMGGVLSGLQTLSRYKPTEVLRYSYEGNFIWPKSLFLLDRCFMVSRFIINSGKELLVINTHNSAYDNGGLRKAQMQQIKAFVLKEYEKGNYIIVGGDWNQCAPDFKSDFAIDAMDLVNNLYIEDDLMPKDWTWLYDNSLPTNRRNSTEYIKGTTLTTVIDFYLLSPNIKALSVKNIDTGFKFSDHQAVKAIVKLIPNNE